MEDSTRALSLSEVVEFVKFQFPTTVPVMEEAGHKVVIHVPATQKFSNGLGVVVGEVSKKYLIDVLSDLVQPTPSLQSAHTYVPLHAQSGEQREKEVSTSKQGVEGRAANPQQGGSSFVGRLCSWVRKVCTSLPSSASGVSAGDDWSLFEKRTRSPKDIKVARELFKVPLGEQPQEAAVNAAYDIEREGHLFRLNRAREKGMTLIVDCETESLQFIDIAYETLMGHPRGTGVD